MYVFCWSIKKRDCCYRICEECSFSKRGCSPHEIRQIQVYVSSPKFADHSQTSTTFRSFLICQRFWSIYTPEKLTWHFKIPISVRNTSSNCGFSIAIFWGVISYVHYLCIYVMFILIYIHVYESEFSYYSWPYHWSHQESQTALVWLEFWPCFAELTFKNRGHRGQLGSISYTHIPIRKKCIPKTVKLSHNFPNCFSHHETCQGLKPMMIRPCCWRSFCSCHCSMQAGRLWRNVPPKLGFKSTTSLSKHKKNPQILNLPQWQARGFKYFLYLPLLGEVIQFDKHIFSNGWFTHQLVESLRPATCFCATVSFQTWRIHVWKQWNSPFWKSYLEKMFPSILTKSKSMKIQFWGLV